MKYSRVLIGAIGIMTVFAAFGALTMTVFATHSWGGYHWARNLNPVTLTLGDNLTSLWDTYLNQASLDWSLSEMVDTTIVAGGTTSKTCKPVTGRVEVCNNRYGRNGWLGIASVWTSGEHIVKGTVKMNDTYFNTVSYNTPAWRNFVLCQEVGHTLGLDHQDEDVNNIPLGTCMDYTSNPNPNQHPNQHDYDMLNEIYAHLDTGATSPVITTQLGQDIDHEDPASWGRLIRGSEEKGASTYVRDLGDRNKIFTFVVWVK